jgi:DNA-binding NarL/FixJ family response regulator
MDVIRVLLADDHRLMRAGVRSLLTALRGVEVVAEADDGPEALEAIESLRPDIALVDITMPGLNGLDVVERAKRSAPECRCIILSMHAGEEYVLQALKVGAMGYLLKDGAVAELELAIHAVRRGDIYLTPSVSRHVIDAYRERTNPGAQESGESPVAAVQTLTSRQREILQLLAEGNSSRAIAERLFLSPRTVETHRANIMARLDVHDTAGLIRHAIKAGLIT